MPSRRAALKAAAAAFALAGCAGPLRIARPAWHQYPFRLGVASGSPLPDGFVLWTRLLGDGDPAQEAVPVRWEVAADEGFRQVLRSGTALALPAFAHSVHVEVDGLAPDRWYHYRFRSGEAESPPGRTRTAPAPGAGVARWRLAYASCQHYEHGYFGAYRHMLEDAPDLVIFLGDYIYEYGPAPGRARQHENGPCVSLEDYRARHALYKRDADLQRMHAAAPWLPTWDDHEVQNDYAGDRGEVLEQDFLARRAAAYRAYWEHMPLRAIALPAGPRMRIHARHDFGALLRIHLLDCRQYKDHQACPRPGRGGSNTVDAHGCAERDAPGRSMLGAQQEAWLEHGLASSKAAWNLIGQQTLMAPVDRQPGSGRRFWTDGWDGYPHARQRLLRFIGRERPSNPVVAGGDVHSNWVCDLKPDFDDPASPVVATEFCGTSISSPSSMSTRRAAALAGESPHVRFVDTARRGYGLMDFEPARLSVSLRVVDDATLPQPRVSTLARFEVDSGTPGARRAG